MKTRCANSRVGRLVAILVAVATAISVANSVYAQFSISIGGKNQIVGSGKVVELPRTVGAFDRVEVKDGIRATLRKGGETKVTVSADDNIEPLVETNINGTTLVLRMKPNTNLRTKNPIAVAVNYVKLEKIGARDGASIDIDSVTAASFALQVSDGASVRSAGVNANRLDIAVSDGASLKLVSARSSEMQTMKVSDGANVTIEVLSGNAMTAKVSDGARLSVKGVDLKSVDVTVSDGASASLSGVAQQQVFAVSDGASVGARELNGESARGRVKDGASLKAGTLKTLELEVDESASVRYAGDPQVTIRSREKLNVKKY
jgi:Cu/Ag efflux protein CusF